MRKLLLYLVLAVVVVMLCAAGFVYWFFSGDGLRRAIEQQATAFLGQPVDETAILIRYTKYGDSDLDQDVDLSDLGNLASSYGQNNASIDWINGDFDHDDDVDLSDLGTLATFYGSGEALAYADFQMLLAVPEPSLAALPLLGISVLCWNHGRRT